MSLPKPVEKQGHVTESMHEVEQAKATEISKPGAVSPPLQDDHQQPASTSPISDTTVPITVSQGGRHTSTMIADDLDLIEKEWVDRAKRVVEQTRTDPYTQSEEINHIKTEYQHKRFNRQIKADET